MPKYFIIILLLLANTVCASFADTVVVKDKTTKKKITFTNEWEEEDFKEVVDFYISSHLKARNVPDKQKDRFQERMKNRWNKWYVAYFSEEAICKGNLFIARYNDRIVGACVFYQAEVEYLEQEMLFHMSNLFSKRLFLASDDEDEMLLEEEMVFGETFEFLPHGKQLTLCTLESFSDCENFGTRTFVSGYRKLALQKYPNAVYWLASAPKKKKNYYKAYTRAGFVETLAHCPHLSKKDCKSVCYFMRKIVLTAPRDA